MRVVNRVAAILLALAMFAGGGLLVAETVTAWLGRPPLVVSGADWFRAVDATSIGDSVVLIVSACGLGLGLVLLFFQLRPWRPVRLPATAPGWAVRRRQAQRSVAAAVNRLPGVERAKARLGRAWRLRVAASADVQDRQAVLDAATAELQRLAATDSRRLRVRLTRRRVV